MTMEVRMLTVGNDYRSVSGMSGSLEGSAAAAHKVQNQEDHS